MVARSLESFSAWGGGEDDPLTVEQRRLPISEAEKSLLEAFRQQEAQDLALDPAERSGFAPLQLDEFVDQFLASEIVADKAWIAKRSQHDQAKTVRAELLEYIITEHAELAGWFGQSVEVATVRASEYDDRRGTDIIFEFKTDDDEVVRLGVDVTVSEDQNNLAAKERLIRQGLEGGELTDVKYFRSLLEPDFSGRLDHLPRIILSAAPEEVQNLAATLSQKGGKKTIGHEPLQLVVLAEQQAQLESQIYYILNLLFKDLSARSDLLSTDQTQELKNLAQAVLDLESTPNRLMSVVDAICSSEVLGQMLNNYPDIANRNYLDNLARLNQLLQITEEIIKEKSGSLDKEVISRAADRQKTNAVLELVSRPDHRFAPSQALEELLAA